MMRNGMTLVTNQITSTSMEICPLMRKKTKKKISWHISISAKEVTSSQSLLPHLSLNVWFMKNQSLHTEIEMKLLT